MINHYAPCNNCGNKIKLEIYIQDDVKIDLNCPYCNEIYKIKGLANNLSCKLIRQENQIKEKMEGIK